MKHLKAIFSLAWAGLLAGCVISGSGSGSREVASVSSTTKENEAEKDLNAAAAELENVRQYRDQWGGFTVSDVVFMKDNGQFGFSYNLSDNDYVTDARSQVDSNVALADNTTFSALLAFNMGNGQNAPTAGGGQGKAGNTTAQGSGNQTPQGNANATPSTNSNATAQASTNTNSGGNANSTSNSGGAGGGSQAGTGTGAQGGSGGGGQSGNPGVSNSTAAVSSQLALRDALIEGFDNKVDANLLNALGHPSPVGQQSHVYFMVAQISCLPGWETKKGYVGQLVSSLNYCNAQGDIDYDVYPGVVAVLPLVDVSIMKQGNQYSSSTNLALQLSAVLAHVPGTASAAFNYLKQLNDTRNSLEVEPDITTFAMENHFGFYFYPTFHALADPAAASSPPAMQIDPANFPAVILVQTNDQELQSAEKEMQSDDLDRLSSTVDKISIKGDRKAPWYNNMVNLIKLWDFTENLEMQQGTAADGTADLSTATKNVTTAILGFTWHMPLPNSGGSTQVPASTTPPAPSSAPANSAAPAVPVAATSGTSSANGASGTAAPPSTGGAMPPPLAVLPNSSATPAATTDSSEPSALWSMPLATSLIPGMSASQASSPAPETSLFEYNTLDQITNKTKPGKSAKDLCQKINALLEAIQLAQSNSQRVSLADLAEMKNALQKAVIVLAASQAQEMQEFRLTPPDDPPPVFSSSYSPQDVGELYDALSDLSQVFEFPPRVYCRIDSTWEWMPLKNAQGGGYVRAANGWVSAGAFPQGADQSLQQSEVIAHALDNAGKELSRVKHLGNEDTGVRYNLANRLRHLDSLNTFYQDALNQSSIHFLWQADSPAQAPPPAFLNNAMDCKSGATVYLYYQGTGQSSDTPQLLADAKLGKTTLNFVQVSPPGAASNSSAFANYWQGTLTVDANTTIASMPAGSTYAVLVQAGKNVLPLILQGTVAAKAGDNTPKQTGTDITTTNATTTKSAGGNIYIGQLIGDEPSALNAVAAAAAKSQATTPADQTQAPENAGAAVPAASGASGAASGTGARAGKGKPAASAGATGSG